MWKLQGGNVEKGMIKDFNVKKILTIREVHNSFLQRVP